MGNKKGTGMSFFAMASEDLSSHDIVIDKGESLLKMTQNEIFEHLVDNHDYWGQNTSTEMNDFCNRNQLHIIQQLLKSN